jgi:hypothetical protein
VGKSFQGCVFLIWHLSAALAYMAYKREQIVLKLEIFFIFDFGGELLMSLFLHPRIMNLMLKLLQETLNLEERTSIRKW